MNTMQYKKYTAEIEYDDNGRTLIGRIQLPYSNQILFTAKSIRKLRKKFEKTVNNYIESGEPDYHVLLNGFMAFGEAWNDPTRIFEYKDYKTVYYYNEDEKLYWGQLPGIYMLFHGATIEEARQDFETQVEKHIQIRIDIKSKEE